MSTRTIQVGDKVKRQAGSMTRQWRNSTDDPYGEHEVAEVDGDSIRLEGCESDWLAEWFDIVETAPEPDVVTITLPRKVAEDIAGGYAMSAGESDRAVEEACRAATTPATVFVELTLALAQRIAVAEWTTPDGHDFSAAVRGALS